MLRYTSIDHLGRGEQRVRSATGIRDGGVDCRKRGTFDTIANHGNKGDCKVQEEGHINDSARPYLRTREQTQGEEHYRSAKKEVVYEDPEPANVFSELKICILSGG